MVCSAVLGVVGGGRVPATVHYCRVGTLVSLTTILFCVGAIYIHWPAQEHCQRSADGGLPDGGPQGHSEAH